MDANRCRIPADFEWQRASISTGIGLTRTRRMTPPLTPNTQAILLLTAPLIAGRGEDSPHLLTLGEYNRLARILREKQKQPADLIAPDAGETVGACASMFGRERLESL